MCGGATDAKSLRQGGAWGAGSPKVSVAGVEFEKSFSRKAELGEDLLHTWPPGVWSGGEGAQVEAEVSLRDGLVTEWWQQAEGLCVEDLLPTRRGEGQEQ